MQVVGLNITAEARSEDAESRKVFCLHSATLCESSAPLR